MVSNQTKNYIIVALLITTILFASLWFRDRGILSGSNPSNTVIAPAPSPGVAQIPTVTGVSTEGTYFKGNENAPVTIIEFSDYQCPFCGRFYSDTLPSIEETYIKTGKVKFYYKDFPLDSIHPHATPAALAARCAGEQGKFWEMHNLIFENQTSLSNSIYAQWAAQLQLDAVKFNDCFTSQKYLSAVRKDLLEGQQAGVRGTPAFLVNGELLSGAQPFPVFQQAIEKALASS